MNKTSSVRTSINTPASRNRQQTSSNGFADNIALAYIEWDESFHVMAWNPASARLFGYSKDEALGRAGFDLIIPEHEQEDFENLLVSNIFQQDRHYGVYQNIRRDGQIILCEWFNTVFADEKGHIVKMISLVQDITEHSRQDDELRRTAELYHSLFDNMPVGLYRTSPNGKILEINRALVDMLGYRDKEHAYSLSTENQYEQPEEHRRWVEQLLREGSMLNYETSWIKADGRPIWVRESAQAVRDRNGDLLYFEGVVEDITHSRHAGKRRQALYRISESAFSATELNQLYRSVHAIVAELLPAQNFFIALYNEKKNTVNFPYIVDENPFDVPDDMSLNEYAPGRGLTAYLLRNGEPMLIDQAAFKALIAAGEVELVGAMPVEWLGIPLKTASGKITGALVVQSYHEDIRYSQEDIDILEFVSTQIAVTIERIRAEEEAHRYINRLKGMRTIDQAILSSNAMQSIAIAALEPIRQQLPCQVAMVMLLDLPNQQMQPLAYLFEAQIRQWTLPYDSYFQDIPQSLRNGESIQVNSLPDQQANFLDLHMRKFGIASYLGLPLLAGGEIIGYLMIGAANENSFTAEHMEIAQEISSSMAVGLQNARLHEETVSLLTREQRLNEISRMLTSTLDTGEILRNVVRLAVELIGFEAGVLSLIENDGEYHEVAGLFNLPDTFDRLRTPHGTGLTWKVIDNGKTQYIPDYAQQPEAMPLMISTGAKSILTIPLIYKNEKLGALSLISMKANKQLLAGDIALANATAQQVAIAIKNARLFESVQKLAITDPLTGLYNRRHFFQIAQREFSQSLRYYRSLSMIMVDLDHFKRVNDTYGHPAGDLVLQEVSSRMRGILRDTDLIGRYGGEEFVILLQETGLEQAIQIAERLRVCIAAAPIRLPTNQTTIQISASLGVAVICVNCQNLEQLLDRADLALYKAKQNGRNQIGVLESI